MRHEQRHLSWPQPNKIGRRTMTMPQLMLATRRRQPEHRDDLSIRARADQHKSSQLILNTMMLITVKFPRCRASSRFSPGREAAKGYSFPPS